MAARRVRAYIGLGANIGDAAATLADAVQALDGLAGVGVRGVSRLYRTSPVGVEDQPDFRNAAVAVDVRSARTDPADAALDLLVDLKGLERRFGRHRRRRWGPRELDLDLLVFGRHRLTLERPPEGRSIDPLRADGRLLVVPHPEARDRLFVLAPLADLAPGLVPPGWGESVASARGRRAVEERPAAVRVVGTWDAAQRRWR
jgi:2-amino-4-hydroxy-6-hydroxymethyldihydropteridine diphosphokinase